MQTIITDMRWKRTTISIAACALFYWAPALFSVKNAGLAMAQTPTTPTAPATATATTSGTPATSSVSRTAQGVTLNFVNAEIAEVARTMGVMTNRSIVVDPRVKGTMNLSTDKPVSTAVAYNQFLTALRLQGFSVVESAGVSKVLPEAEAKLQGGSVSTSESKVSGNQIVTQIFRLNYESANNLVPILRPLISPNNTINVNPGNNSLIITDYADNMQRMARIISALDISNATDLEIIPLQHALAAELAPLLVRLSEGGSSAAAPGGQGDSSFRTSILPEARSNTLIVRTANAARLAMIKALVVKLDQPTSALASGNIHVVYLKNADAIRVAATLRAALAANTAGAASAGGGGGGGGAAAAPAPAAQPAAGAAGGAGGAGSSAASTPTSQNALPTTGGNIQADPATNSLIITASEPQYRQIRAVIDMLDTRRAQVFVESLIVEVSDNKGAEFGIQWQNILGNTKDKTIGVLGTNYGSANILQISKDTATSGAAGLASLGKGFNFGLVNKIGGTYVLGLLANFLQTTGDGNVLSTPNLLTIDNEEAKIVIGQNVPFVTGQFTNAGGGGNNGTVNPFQTVERKDVGITLRVKPQISENGTIKMQIFQEVSSVDAATKGDASGPTTNKRSIESSVLVQDGGIVVIGGLLQDDYSNTQNKVPGLGDIPILGALFKSEARSRKKTNLMVFLRPVVVRDSESTENLSLDRYDIMRSLQKDAQPNPSWVLPINESPVLPPQTQPKRSSTPPAPVPAPLGAPVEKEKVTP
jgi:general secretion pathway protein D